MTDDVTEAERVFILGLDGVPWRFIERWASAGELPNFRRLFDEGAAGPLRSTVPASTPLAWPSIATGKWPDKHGLYGFQHLSPEYTRRMYTSEDCREPPLWEMLSPAVVGNVPMTYPVGDVDGKMVGGLMSTDIDEQYVSPPELADEITQRIPDYQISLKWGEYVGRESALVEDIASLLEMRRELMRLLMETTDWRLFFFAYIEPDRLQHLVWDDDVLLEHYQQLDEILGEVLEYAESYDSNLFVVSDHGFGSVSKAVAVNSVLQSEGLLVPARESGSKSALATLGVTKSNVRGALDRLGIEEHVLVRKYLPQSAVDFFASEIPGNHWLYDLDHSETAAFVHEFGNVYVNDTERFAEGAVSPDQRQAVKREVMETLSAVTDPETGERPLTVHDGDELFPRDDFSPDVVIQPQPGYELTNDLDSDVFVEPEAEASHRMDGIFFAWGPNVDAGVRPDGLSVVDVAPTALHSVGHPVPEDADGDVIHEIFTPDSAAATASVERTRYDATETTDTVDRDYDDVEERLRGLGYME